MTSESLIPLVVAFAFNGYENANGKLSAKCKFCKVVIKEKFVIHINTDKLYLIYIYILIVSLSHINNNYALKVRTQY